jgi:hypothetical protein
VSKEDEKRLGKGIKERERTRRNDFLEREK